MSHQEPWPACQGTCSAGQMLFLGPSGPRSHGGSSALNGWVTLLSCSSVFRALSPVFLHHPHRAGALLLHLHIHSPGPPSVHAVPQSFGPRRGLTGHSSGGALGHLYQPGPGDRRGAPRACGLGRGPPTHWSHLRGHVVRPSSPYCT